MSDAIIRRVRSCRTCFRGNVGSYFEANLSKLAFSYFRRSGKTTRFIRENGMCDRRLRQGPEGRQLNVSPARKGWVLEGKPERRKRGTLPRPTPT
jgi:hypothetical protein